VLPLYYTPCFRYLQATLEDFCFCILSASVKDLSNLAVKIQCIFQRGNLVFLQSPFDLITGPALNNIIPPALFVVHNRVLLNRLCNLFRGHGLIIVAVGDRVKGWKYVFIFFIPLLLFFYCDIIAAAAPCAAGTLLALPPIHSSTGGKRSQAYLWGVRTILSSWNVQVTLLPRRRLKNFPVGTRVPLLVLTT